VVVCLVADFSDSLNSPVYASPLKRHGLAAAVILAALPFGNWLSKVTKRGGSPILLDASPACSPSLIDQLAKPTRNPPLTAHPSSSLASLVIAIPGAAPKVAVQPSTWKEDDDTVAKTSAGVKQSSPMTASPCRRGTGLLRRFRVSQ
jgi:hypothetical protein